MALQTNKYGQQESFIPSRPHESTNFAAASCRTDAHSSDTSTTLISHPAPSLLGRLRRRTPTATRGALSPGHLPRTFQTLSSNLRPSPVFCKTPDPRQGTPSSYSATQSRPPAASEHLRLFTPSQTTSSHLPGPSTHFAHELASLVRDILEIPSVHTVIVGEPIWRLRLPPYMRDFHARVREFSKTLRPLIDSIPNTTTWRHCKLWQKNPDYFVADGLHLSDFGNLRYYKSIRYAILPHLPSR
ncbi:hypothetical protein Bbelb_054050 [Branchiostoma belcheri]|nr:hypothetical protein Bbelb_054050 [Branchiostoma belcheri]